MEGRRGEAIAPDEQATAGACEVFAASVAPGLPHHPPKRLPQRPPGFRRPFGSPADPGDPGPSACYHHRMGDVLLSSEDSRRRRCFLAMPFSQEFTPLRDTVEKGAKAAGFRVTTLDRPLLGDVLQDVLINSIARADCVIADLTGARPSILFEVGLAQGIGKDVFLLAQDAQVLLPSLAGRSVLLYEPSASGLATLERNVTKYLQRLRRLPRRIRPMPGVRPAAQFFVDWDRLDRSEADNLCRELLLQMGYRRVTWTTASPVLDLVAELPRKDPDGYEYSELWLISFGRNEPIEMLLEMASQDPDFLARRMLRHNIEEERLSKAALDAPLTILLINLRGEQTARGLERMRRVQVKHRGATVRIRIWDRDYLTALLQQFPQIGLKYFSEEGRLRSVHRKTYEEVYLENVAMSEQQARLISDLTEERTRRTRAERDALWKDVSFNAAHKLGNPIFAIETNLDPLEKRVKEHRFAEALGVIAAIRVSVEKAKAIIDQFKSLTKARELRLAPTAVRPLLEEVCQSATVQGIKCEIECASDLQVLADAERLSECLDELLANAQHSFDSAERKIDIHVLQPAQLPLPDGLDLNVKYACVRFTDNGRGVEPANKTRIFDAFFTTYVHGTGLGLALVRRIIDDHHGAIIETGLMRRGAVFEIYLPSVEVEQDNTQPKDTRKRKPRSKR